MGCRVAIVDSGIDSSYKSDISSVYSYINENYEDINGHGTKCFSIIQDLAPNTEFVIIKLLNKDLKCTSNQLKQVLNNLLDMDIDVINLSLSTSSLEQFEDLDQICKQLYQQGKIIVAAKNNIGKVSYPAESKYVLGVEGNFFENNYEFWYEDHNPIQCIGSKTPTIVRYANKYCFFGGNSKATACLSGILARNWNQLESFDQKQREIILSKLAYKNSWRNEDILKEISFKCEDFSQINNDILNEIFLEMKINIGIIKHSDNVLGIIGKNKISDFLEILDGKLGGKGLIKNVKISDFGNLNTLSKKINQIINNFSLI